MFTGPRTFQHMLAERRALVEELRTERDKTARAVLEAQIKILDEDIDERTEPYEREMGWL